MKKLNILTKGDKYSRLELTIYAVSWAFVFSLPLLIQIYDVLAGEIQGYRWDRILVHIKLMLPIFLLFLLNNFALLPRLFWKRRKAWYFAVLIALFILLWYVQEPPQPQQPPMQQGYSRQMPPGPPAPSAMFHITSLIIQLCVVLANFGIKLYIQSIRREMLMLNIQNEKMLQEVEALKYQISPHFLMNTLNNIQSLIATSPDAAYNTIQRLSKMMRYLLYDNNAQSVPLRNEVEFLRNFIDLMKIRYPSTLNICAEFPGNETDVNVPPLLFVSFIENAFKHGVSYTEESIITVSIGIDDSMLTFYCANINAKDSSKKKNDGGIGLKNARRRLDLIYGDEYELAISDTDMMYIVELKFPI